MTSAKRCRAAALGFLYGKVKDMAEKRDYYEVLGVDRGADDATLKKAYRQLAMQPLTAERAAEPAALADLISAAIWAIFSATFSAICSEAAEEDGRTTVR